MSGWWQTPLRTQSSIQPETGAIRDEQALFLPDLGYLTPWGRLLNCRKRSGSDTPVNKKQIFLWSIWWECWFWRCTSFFWYCPVWTREPVGEREDGIWSIRETGFSELFWSKWTQDKCNGVEEKKFLTHKESLPVCVLLVGIDYLTEIMPLTYLFMVGSSCTYAGCTTPTHSY